jgi:hypothetical protein
MFNKFLLFENRAVYEIMWKYIIVQLDRLQMTKWRMRIACWITKATDTHAHAHIILVAFSRNGAYANAPECYVYAYIACLT